MVLSILFAIFWAMIQGWDADTIGQELQADYPGSYLGLVAHSTKEDSVAIQRGLLISAEKLDAMSKEAIRHHLASEGVPGIPDHGVSLYRVTYWTINVDGDKIKASGAIAVPDGLEKPAPLLS